MAHPTSLSDKSVGVVNFRCSAEEKGRLVAAATRAGVDLSSYMRLTLFSRKGDPALAERLRSIAQAINMARRSTDRARNELLDAIQDQLLVLMQEANSVQVTRRSA